MDSIVKQHGSAQQKILDSILNPVRQMLTDGWILQYCRSIGHVWRCRRFCPVVSLLTCIWKQLGQFSARDVEDYVALLARTCDDTSRDGRDFCNARARLPLPLFQRAQELTGAMASNSAPRRYKHLRVALLDGTTLRTAATTANRKAFGSSTNQHGSSHSPVLRLALLLCAGCGAVLDLAFGPYTVSEARLFTLLISRLPSAMLVVGDTTACSFTIFAMALQRGSHLLCPLCPGRKRQVLRRLSRNDTLELWPRSTPAHVIYPQFLRELPAAIEVRVIERSIRRRGYRDYKVTLVTTLLDAKEFPANDLVQQYLQRWDIELDIRTLKHQHGLEILSGLTPQVACREMYAAILAYNCVRALMAQASATPRRLSHHRSNCCISPLKWSAQQRSACQNYLQPCFISFAPPDPHNKIARLSHAQFSTANTPSPT